MGLNFEMTNTKALTVVNREEKVRGGVERGVGISATFEFLVFYIDFDHLFIIKVHVVTQV